MNFNAHEEEDFNGNVLLEAHKEMVQCWGAEKPDQEWILTDFDVWEKNPYFTGTPTNRHPEDDCY